MQTITEQFIKTTEVMGSKFIAILIPLEDDANFKELIASLKKEHKKARHICYAYRVGQKSKSNDDGEPKGTAGRPMLELLHKRDLNNIALVVVRYFGGTKLGAGRLLRTYVQSGINVMNTATYVAME